MVAQLLSWSTSSVFILLFSRHLQYHAVFTAARFFSSQFQSYFLGIFVETLTLSPILWPQYVSVTLIQSLWPPLLLNFFKPAKSLPQGCCCYVLVLGQGATWRPWNHIDLLASMCLPGWFWGYTFLAGWF